MQKAVYATTNDPKKSCLRREWNRRCLGCSMSDRETGNVIEKAKIWEQRGKKVKKIFEVKKKILPLSH